MDPFHVFLLSWEREMEIRREANNPHRLNRIFEDKAKEPDGKGASARWVFSWPGRRRQEQPCEG